MNQCCFTSFVLIFCVLLTSVRLVYYLFVESVTAITAITAITEFFLCNFSDFTNLRFCDRTYIYSYFILDVEIHY